MGNLCSVPHISIIINRPTHETLQEDVPEIELSLGEPANFIRIKEEQI